MDLFDPNESMFEEKKIEVAKPKLSTGQNMMAEMLRTASQKKKADEKTFGDSSDEDDKPKEEPKVTPSPV